MCPADLTWQHTIADTVGNIVGAGAAGVYIDQIAAAGPKPCFDPSHGHPLGGGSHWVQSVRFLDCYLH